MISSTGILILTTLIGFAQSQAWNGVYNIDSGCDIQRCCCISGQLIISPLSDQLMLVKMNTKGICEDRDNIQVSSSYPIGYTGFLQAAGIGLQIRLDATSNIITIVNPTKSICTSTGRKVKL